MNIAYFQQKLTERKEYLEQSLDQIESSLDKPHSKDFEDDATEREGDEVLEHLGNAELIELRQVNDALQRIEKGGFGVCAACSGTISTARLEIVPHTQKCRNCA